CSGFFLFFFIGLLFGLFLSCCFLFCFRFGLSVCFSSCFGLSLLFRFFFRLLFCFFLCLFRSRNACLRLFFQIGKIAIFQFQFVFGFDQFLLFLTQCFNTCFIFFSIFIEGYQCLFLFIFHFIEFIKLVHRKLLFFLDRLRIRFDFIQ